METFAPTTKLASASVTIGPWQRLFQVSTVNQESLDPMSLVLSGSGNYLYLFAKGEDNFIYWTPNLSSSTVLQKLQFGGVAPMTKGGLTAAATSVGQLTLAWSAVDQGFLWMNTYEEGNWTGPQVVVSVPPAYSSNATVAPALAVQSGLTYLLWAGGVGSGYFYSYSGTPAATDGGANTAPWAPGNVIAGTGPQIAATSPQMVLSSSDQQLVLLVLWAEGSKINYGIISNPAAASFVEAVPAPAGASSIYAAASIPISESFVDAAAGVLLWKTGDYLVHVGGRWLDVQTAANNFQPALDPNVRGMAACCIGSTIYVAWVTGSTITIQSAPVTIGF